MQDQCNDGVPYRWLNIIDEYTRKCLYSIPQRHWNHKDIIDCLSGLFILHGTPQYLRSDNGSEFASNDLAEWLQRVGVTPLYIEPGSPWENGYCESFNSKIRDEFLNITLFINEIEARVLTQLWIQEYNTLRPHSSLGYRSPEAFEKQH